MEIKTSRNEDELTVALSGRLDTLTSPVFEKKMKEELEGVNKLIVDLSELEYISSAGLRVLLISYRAMENRNGMVVRNPAPMIVEVFKITGFAEIFGVE